MNTNKNNIGNLSSSSAFIIIIILVVVSVAAIIVGGGDGFSRKYAGITFQDIAGQNLLAQTGVVGKNLRFTENGGVVIEPIELPGEVLGVNQRFASAVVPPLEGDNPFWYRTSTGSKRSGQGYPLRGEFVADANLTGLTLPSTGTLPLEVPGMQNCASGSAGFSVFFEDVAYETGVGFDDQELGEARRDAVCDTLNEFSDILRVEELGLNPGIVVQSSLDGTPDNALAVVSPQYVGGSGFVSTLLADYLRTGQKRSVTNISDTVSTLGINSGFVRYNFDQYDWALNEDELNDNTYDLRTVTRQNMLRLLGFGSFIGHEQENILSSAWKRWTEWDRLLKTSQGALVNFETFDFQESGGSVNSIQDADANEYDSKIISEGLHITGVGSIPDFPQLVSIAFSQKPIKTFEDTFIKGQSISGLADPQAVSYPILDTGVAKEVTQAEREILCMLGLAVNGVAGCEAPRTVVQNTYIERQNNQPVCVNLFDNIANSATDEFQLASPIVDFFGNVDTSSSSEEFKMYDIPCPSNGVFTFNDFNGGGAVASPYPASVVTDTSDAVSFAWLPESNIDIESGNNEYVRFLFSVRDSISGSGRVSDEGEIAIHKCVVSGDRNQICNGDFQLSAARSPIDFQLATLESMSVEIEPGEFIQTIGCQGTAAPGWCAQGTPDIFSSEFGYTWHPYLLENPEAFDTNQAEPRNYAGTSSEVIIQRLRVPLAPGAYTVTGKVYLNIGESATPYFYYGSAGTVSLNGETNGAILKQPDGSYHIDYPAVLGATQTSEAHRQVIVPEVCLDENGDSSGVTEATGWHCFTTTIEADVQMTHIGFGSRSAIGTVYFDDLELYSTPSCVDCAGDFNGDCIINVSDMSGFLGTFGTLCPFGGVGCEGDYNFDGIVNISDMSGFLAQFGELCEPVDDGENMESAFDPSLIIISEDDESVKREDVEVAFQFSAGEQVVPNTQGFRSNLRVTIENNRNSAIDDLNIFGVLGGVFDYNAHVATEENIAFDEFGNKVFLPRLGRNDRVDVYFNVELQDSICSQIRRDERGQSYQILVDVGLCDSYQEILEKQYGIRRDERGNVIPSRGGGRNPLQNNGDLQGNPGDPQCDDGIDNDGDGLIDLADPDCVDKNDTSESPSNSTECSDGIDNDGNGRIDMNDPNCSDPSDDDESAPMLPECSDGVDNDRDGKIDFPLDTECADANDTSEER